MTSGVREQTRFSQSPAWWVGAWAFAIAAVWLGSHWLTQQRRPTVPTSVAPATPGLARGAAFVDAEVESWGAGTGLAPEYLYALSAMNYVQSTITGSMYARLRTRRQLPATLDAEKCLALRAGMCGNQMDAFDKILTRCRIPVKRRAAEFYLHDEKHNDNSSHVVAEVFYKDGWRMLDLTAGTFFVRRGAATQDDLLSAEEIRALIRRGEPWRDLAVANNAVVSSRQLAWEKSDPYRYLEWPETDLLLGRDGVIRLFADSSGSTFSFQHLPNALGQSADYCGNVGNLAFRLDGKVLRAAQKGSLEIAVQNVRRIKGDAKFVAKNGKRVLFSQRLSEIAPERGISIDIRGLDEDLILEIDPEAGLGALHIRQIAVR